MPKARKKQTIYVIGHKNPDTDAICSAIAYAAFLRKRGERAEAVKLGPINPETKFVLNYFKSKTPKTLVNAAGKKIILVDHNEKEQGPKNIEKAEILEVIDNNKIVFRYIHPIPFNTKPIGSTFTIIAKKYFSAKKKGK